MLDRGQDVVDLTVIREGEETIVEVTVGDKPSDLTTQTPEGDTR